MADEKNITSSSGSELGVDEKNIVSWSESQFSRSDDEGQEITWTEEEEKALVRRYVAIECCCDNIETEGTLTQFVGLTSLSCRFSFLHSLPCRLTGGTCKFKPFFARHHSPVWPYTRTNYQSQWQCHDGLLSPGYWYYPVSVQCRPATSVCWHRPARGKLMFQSIHPTLQPLTRS